MRLENYIEQVGLYIKGYLPEVLRNAELRIQPQRKNNGLLHHGLVLTIPGQYICPVLSLENYYQDYKNGASMEETFSCIGRDYLSAMESVNRQGSDLSYGRIKGHIFPCAVNAERNRMILNTVPHQKMEDLAVLYRRRIPSVGNQTGSMMISNSMLDLWGISQRELHDQALQNMGHMFTLDFQPMEAVISKLLGFPHPVSSPAHNGSSLFVLTNTENYYGASYLCCPDVLKWVSEKIKGSFLVLPTSINELAVIKETDAIDPSDMKELVEMSNMIRGNGMEYLSDNIYRYDAQEQSFSMIAGNEQHQGIRLML